MTAAEYLFQILHKYHADTSHKFQIRAQVEPLLRSWASQFFVELKDSGSMAKETGLNVNSDYDFLVSLSNSLQMSLKDIFNSLHDCLKNNGYPRAKAQNVSVNISCLGKSVDITPGHKHSNFLSGDHSLYLSRKDTWRKTNIDTHIQYVKSSYRINEIKLAKIWRYNHSLEFPSILIEVLTVESLRSSHGTIDQNFWRVLEFIRDNICTRDFYDPGNQSNNLSDLLTQIEKTLIRNKAIASLSAKNWSQIVW